MSVLLGICDQPVHNDEGLDWKTNKFGGNPNWPEKKVEIPICPLCHQKKLLVLQLYCPLDGSVYHRTLYLFVCLQRQCHSQQTGWTVLRCQEVDKSSTTKTPSKPSSEDFEMDSWCDDADEWGDDDDNSDLVTLATPVKDDPSDGNASSEMPELDLKALNIEDIEDDEPDVTEVPHCVVEDISVDLAQSNLPNLLRIQDEQAAPSPNTVTKSGTHLVPYYINAFEEPDKSETKDKHVLKLLRDYQMREGQDLDDMTPPSGGSKSSEKYEKGIASHGDKTFHKFQKRIALCPEQCLRYSWSGSPLRISSGSLPSIPPCTSCWAQRIYELQIMPALVNKLTLPNGTGGAIEFGSVHIYTCINSCWEDSEVIRTEFPVLELDPDEKLFR